MKKIIVLFVFTGILLSCGPLLPPRIDLLPMQQIGLITFSQQGAEGPLNMMATQRFLQEITWAQPGIRIVELGTLEEVLADTGHQRLGPEAARAIGQRFRVTSFFTGRVAVSEIRPELDLAVLVKSLGIRAKFDIELNARLIESQGGATLWTDGFAAEGTVAHVRFTEGRLPSFAIRDHEKAYRQMVERMVLEITRDFRPSRGYRRY